VRIKGVYLGWFATLAPAVAVRDAHQAPC
jgi:hypothetical protein